MTIPVSVPYEINYLVVSDGSGNLWAEIPAEWITWFTQVQELAVTDLTALTGGGDTTLHYHTADRLSIDTINSGETFTIPTGHQLVIAEQLTNSGTLINDGKVYLI